MRRLVLIFMMCLLPFQWSWAAVGEYCQHESNAKAAQHFGHHVHVHKTDGKHDPGKKLFDGDCSFCHAGTPVTLAAGEPHVPVVAMRQTLVSPRPQVLTSAHARAPDRPQWPRLA